MKKDMVIAGVVACLMGIIALSGCGKNPCGPDTSMTPPPTPTVGNSRTPQPTPAPFY